MSQTAAYQPTMEKQEETERDRERRDLATFSRMLHDERFQQARDLMYGMIEKGTPLTAINSNGYNVVMNYSYVNPDKARRVCEAFRELH